jgi:hypothetical protein
MLALIFAVQLVAGPLLALGRLPRRVAGCADGKGVGKTAAKATWLSNRLPVG